MPLNRCSDGGSSGWRWGDAGKCFIGADAKQRAIKQGVAIEGSAAVGRTLRGTEHETEMFMAFSAHPDDGLTPGGKFAKGNKRGTRKKKPGERKGKPFTEDENSMERAMAHQARQRSGMTFR